jgi:hypothetical protein
MIVIVDDLMVIVEDGRGKYLRNLFCDYYPEILISAKQFALSGATRKN